MGISIKAWRLCNVAIRRVLIVGVFAVMVVLPCYWTSYYSLLDAADGSSIALPVEVSISTTEEKGVSRSTTTNVMPDVTFVQSKGDAYENEADLEHELRSDGNSRMVDSLNKVESHEDATYSFTQKWNLNEKPQLLKSPLSVLNNEKKMGTSSLRSKLMRPTSITQMNNLLLQSLNSSSMGPRWPSRSDRELLSAKLAIENGCVISNSSGLYKPIFRTIASFQGVMN